MMTMETIVGLVALVIVPLVSSEVCYYGNEPDPNLGNKLRWVLQVRDPCRCTAIRLGGVNSMTPKRAFQSQYEDEPFTTQDATEIRKKFNCSDVPHQATDCQSVMDSGEGVNGVYTIHPRQFPDGLQVYCEMSDNKGWIVFQRRVDGTVNFTRSWAEYRDGFGDKEGEFWLGNEILRRLTEPVDGEQEWEMRVDLIVAGTTLPLSGVYADVHVDAENYTLHVGAFTDLQTQLLSDGLSPTPEPPSNGQPFSTYDRDNDAEPSLNCADELKGGWWFNRCTVTRGDFYDDGAGPHSNLNGEYSQTSNTWVYGRGIVWAFLTGRITHSEMKMRRKIN